MRPSWCLVPALILSGAALAGCSDDDAAETPVVPVVATPTPTPTGPVLLGKGVIKDGVKVDRDGPSAFSVRVVTVPPGGSTGWHTHAGTETSVVTKGELTLVRAGACDPVVYRSGDAVFVAAGAAHMARNTGTEPAEVVVTYLLDTDAPDRADATPAC